MNDANDPHNPPVEVTPGEWYIDTLRHVVATDTPRIERGAERDEIAACPDTRNATAWEHGDARAIRAIPAAREALACALPLLVMLGDYIGNDHNRCTVILAVREALAGLGGGK